MAIADRKLREWNLREQLILETADELLNQHGYLGLNLDHLAKRIEYSKATVYNHFTSKEDLVLAVVTMHLKTRNEYFSRALTFDGRARERVFVIGIADMILAKLYPQWFSLMQLVSTPSIWEKADNKRHQAYAFTSSQCMKVMFEIIRQARNCGDLAEEYPTDGHILSGLVSMAKGTHLLTEGLPLLSDQAGIHPQDLLFDNYNLFLDGVGWRPLTTEWDYDATQARIESEVFGEEMRRLQNP